MGNGSKDLEFIRKEHQKFLRKCSKCGCKLTNPFQHRIYCSDCRNIVRKFKTKTYLASLNKGYPYEEDDDGNKLIVKD